jgi:chitinase
MTELLIFNSLRKAGTVRACTANSTGLGVVGIASDSRNLTLPGNTTTSAPGSCVPKGSLIQVKQSLQLAFKESNIAATLTDLEDAAEQLTGVMAGRSSNCDEITAFTYSNLVTLGIFAGSRVKEIAKSVLPQFIAQIKSTWFSENIVVPLCAKDGGNSKYGFGIAVSGNRDVPFVHEAVATWASGQCITSYNRAELWHDVTLLAPSLLANSTSSNSTNSTGVHTLSSRRSNFSIGGMCAQRFKLHLETLVSNAFTPYTLLTINA